MNLADEEVIGLQRMLARFIAALPPHELGHWYIELAPLPTTVENEDPPNRARLTRDGQGVRVQGYAECIRCLARYEIPNIGNFLTRPDCAGRTIERAKEWVAGIAERDGPCWGRSS